MQFRIFTIPVADDGTAIEEMNRFLRGHKVLEVEQQLISTKIGSHSPRQIPSPVRDGMSVENIPYPVLNPVRDDTRMPPCRHVFFYRHVGGVSKAASCRHCEEERRSNPVIISIFWIASLRSQ